MLGVIDCGTTNTRFSLIDENGNYIISRQRKVGVRDTAIRNNREYLRKMVGELICDTIAEAGRQISDLDIILASGMITSEIGLVEIPHLVAPVDKRQLAKNIWYFGKERRMLGIEAPVAFIPGVRNHYGEGITLENVYETDFMRGEEVQAIAVGERYGMGQPLNLVVLSSHTKIISISSDGQIEGSVTTMSGQLFDALLSHTFLGKSVAVGEHDNRREFSDSGLIDRATQAVQKDGLLRLLMTPRFMEVFMKTGAGDRLIYLDAIIAGEDMKAFDEIERKGMKSNRYVLFGQKVRCDIYEYLLRKRQKDAEIIKICEKNELINLTVRGSLLVYGEYRAMEEGKYVQDEGRCPADDRSIS